MYSHSSCFSYLWDYQEWRGGPRWRSNHHMELGQVTEVESFSMGSCPLQTYLFEKLVTKIEGSQNYIHQNGKFKLPGVITTESSS